MMVKAFSALEPLDKVSDTFFVFLEDEAPAGGVAHFVQVGVASKLDHGWRTTHQDECVVSRGRKAVTHHVLTDEPLAVLPVCHMNDKNSE